MSNALIWFREDLRLTDNPALSAACQNHKQVLCVYILDAIHLGEAQKWWLMQSLQSLQHSLAEKNAALLIVSGDPFSILTELSVNHQCDHLYWNRRYEPNLWKLDNKLEQALTKRGLTVQTFPGALFFEPNDIHNQSGQYFKVFTPFWKNCLAKLSPKPSLSAPTIKSLLKATDPRTKIPKLLPDSVTWASGFAEHWMPGEKGAIHRLEHFVNNHVGRYQESRNIPSLQQGTSRLSPHLRFGELSPGQIWHALQTLSHTNASTQESIHCYLSELGWREFCSHLLFHFPKLPHQNFKPQFDKFSWANKPKQLLAWQKGLTGYPLVDAGMRELWHTGFMHNRVRMVVASFLTKHLLIHWSKGAEWFWDTLLDADLANNSANWQWVAGSGADAAPYFRIFNPISQGEKFDPEGIYIKHWCPELRAVPIKSLHKLEGLPSSYPKPLVDHQTARQRALATYQAIRS